MKKLSNTKTIIEEVAIQLFAEKGFRATSTREIAEKASVAKPMLYYYFKNKDDLYNQILIKAIAPVTEEITTLKNSDLSSADKIREYININIRFAENQLQYRALLRRAIERNDCHVEELTNRFFIRIHTAILQIVTDGIEKGDFISQEPELATIQLHSLMEFYLNNMNIMKKINDVSEKELMQQMMSHILSTLLEKKD